jgi:hypothetical protein
MTSPTVLGPDGTYRTRVDFSTTVTSRFVEGTYPAEAADLQVSIDGAAFSSDPSLILWGEGKWVVPNPAYEALGLNLLPGENRVRVRAILLTGSTTAEAEARIQLLSDGVVGVVASSPTNVSVTQNNSSVTIRAEASAGLGFRGMNFWASASEGGGATGYFRINVETVISGVEEEEEEEFATFGADATILVDAENNPVADPMFFRVRGQQETEGGATLQVDLNQRFEIPETAREIRFSAGLRSVRKVTRYGFDHSRSFGPRNSPPTVRVGEFASLSIEEPLFYVVTAVYYDETRNLEYESAYSEEVVGRPITVTTALTSFPSPSRQTIVEQFITTVFRSNPQVKVEAGSILRDTVIDPFSSEAQRIRFILDFFHRARTPALLLQIDDPNGTGISVPVSQSPYKQGLQAAFFLRSAGEVQDVIDAAFEAYASNFGLQRRSGVSAQTEVLFFTTRRPNQTLAIPLGTLVSGAGVQFVTTRAVSIPFDQLASYFNPVTGRYGVTAPVRAANPGSAGNVGVGQINTLVTSLSGSLSVVNSAAATGGKNQESNLDLTVRVQNRLASVDSGTSRGYLQTAADTPGVVQANVVAAGDPLMQRDLYEGQHRGGKVDVWVQGSNLATVTDTFAFSFVIAQDIQFEVIGDPGDLRFRALDTSLSAENPIVEMLDDPAVGYVFRNATTGEEFDLSGVTLPTFDTIQLSTALPQPSVDFSDVVLGSYRRRAGNRFVLPRQPVQEVLSVVGSVSGQLPQSSLLLVRPDAPLSEGRSIFAQDYLEISASQGIPSGDRISVVGEEHVLVGSSPEFLDNLGANFLSISVTDETGAITYRGPNDPSGDADYTITLGTQTVPVSLTRVEAGDIPSGARVLVSYEHDENFSVTYRVNLIVSQTQAAIESRKHATADVLVKEAIPIPLDLRATIVLVRGRDRALVDSAVRTNLANFFNNLRLGDPVRQSDLIDVIERTEGVSWVIVPLSLMVPQAGATIVREGVSADTAAESTFLTSLSTSAASVYIFSNPLLFATEDGGGPLGSFRAVFRDDIALDLLEADRPLSALGLSSGRAYLLGSVGRSIPGFSDDATLIAQGFVTSGAIEQRRRELTADRILTSLPVGLAPPAYRWAVTYVTTQGSGAQNVEPGAAQFVSAGDFLFTYDEDR